MGEVTISPETRIIPTEEVMDKVSHTSHAATPYSSRVMTPSSQGMRIVLIKAKYIARSQRVPEAPSAKVRVSENRNASSAPVSILV